MAKVVRFSVAMLDCWRVYVDRSGVYFKVPANLFWALSHISLVNPFQVHVWNPLLQRFFFFGKCLRENSLGCEMVPTNRWINGSIGDETSLRGRGLWTGGTRVGPWEMLILPCLVIPHPVDSQCSAAESRVDLPSIRVLVVKIPGDLWNSMVFFFQKSRRAVWKPALEGAEPEMIRVETLRPFRSSCRILALADWMDFNHAVSWIAWKPMGQNPEPEDEHHRHVG